MIFTLPISLKKILALLFLSGLLFVFAGVTSGQQATPSAQPVDEISDLTFPIPELGNCADFKTCMVYCDDPVNNATCVDYAKIHGFYESDPVIAPTDEFFEEADAALGCNTAESCLEFCSQEANFDACDTFAGDNAVIGGYVAEPDNPQYLDVARQVLGCDSATSCVAFCDNPANADRCSQFASQVGLLGGQTTIGPGGCTSAATCDNFCRDPQNYSSCAVFAPPGGSFTGPGGCSSPESCRSHCEQNPADCRSYAPGSNGLYVPVACPAGQFFGPGGACTAVEKTQEAGACAQGGKFWSGTTCSDQAPPGVHSTVGGAYFQPRPEMGNCKTPVECYDYCSSNPGRCSGFSTNAERPKDDYIPSLYYTPGIEVKFTPKSEMGNCDSPGSCYDFCKANPSQCQGFNASAPRPSDTYAPGTYYTPPANYTYFTPPATSFYVTPIYYTPPAGSNYTTPQYFTPGTYYTPTYYTPFSGSNYTTPTYYTPGSYYVTPTGQYPTPQYLTPYYYTPPEGSNYTTPTYYTPPPYHTPYYYTPTDSNYTTPTYYTPGYSYPTPGSGYSYPSPTYYSYPTPSGGYSYPSPSYYSYPTPGSYSYPTPGSYSYPTPGSYSYPSPSYGSPSYGSPSYGSPSYGTPDSYSSPSYGSPYGTPSYGTPGTYATPGSVAGASAKKSILDIILSFFSGR